MQEAIMQIGNAVYSEELLLEGIVRPLASTVGKKQQHIIKLNFLLDEKCIQIDAKEQVSEESPVTYVYIDKIGGPTSPQWIVTRNKAEYHVMESIPSLNKLDIADEVMEDQLSKMVQEFFIDRGDDKPDKYRYVLNLELLDQVDVNMKQLMEDIEGNAINEKECGKEIAKSLVQIIESTIKDKYGLSKKEIAIYTICINDIPIATTNAYKDLVKRKKFNLGQEDDQQDKSVAICSLCHKGVSVPSNLSFQIKFFTTNQVIFASNLDKQNYDKNMTICQGCMARFLLGESYVKNHLRTKLFGFDVYLIPHFIIGEPLDKIDLDNGSENVLRGFASIKNYDGMKKFQEDMDMTNSMSQDTYYTVLNIVFYKEVKQGTKVRRMIKDVNPSIFHQIQSGNNRVVKIMKKHLGDGYNSNISLSSIYFLTPVRLNSGEPKQYQDLLNLYDAILSKRLVKRYKIINNILQVIRIIRFEKASYNIDVQKNSLHYTILQGNMLIKFLEHMGCLKGDENMEEIELNVAMHIQDFVRDMNYSQEQIALFLLGYMIGEIGNVQYKRNDEKKPILNKLNYGGMDIAKIMRLVNDVHMKLKQEKLLKYNEMNFFECKRLMDQSIGNWSLNKNENLFYILSGYGYATTKPMLMKKEEVTHE